MVYEEEKKLLNKRFVVIKPWRIGNCKMKKEDVLQVVDYGSGMASHYVEFTNSRLKHYRFTTGTWLFKNNTREIK